jgi:outer membrane protein OmpA-like peptidoglycan-associated protein
MAIDILDALKSAFGAPVTRQVSTVFGDSEEATRTGLRSSFSALLAGVLHKSTTPGGAEEVYRTVTSDSVDPTLPSRLPGLLSNRGSLENSLSNGESMLSSIFGNRTSNVSQAIAESSGLKPSSATGLLAMAAPMLMGVLKKHVTQNNLDARGLGSLLLNQRSALQNAGLDSRITSAMGLPNAQSLFGTGPSIGTGASVGEPRTFGATGNGRTEQRSAAYSRSVPDRPRGRWIPWAVAAVLAIAILGFLSSRIGTRQRASVAAAGRAPASANASLPLSVYFDVGRSDLSPNDQRAIAAVAVTVKASSTPVAVTGYADSSGNAEQNVTLAQNRASAVRDQLVRDGVSSTRVLMAPPTAITPGAPANESRRVDIKIAQASDAGGVAR